MENSTINPLHLANITIEEDVIKKITDNAAAAAEELCKAGRLNEHSILVVGCSSSEVIGELVMNKLKNLEAVAYVRFASVYREFKDINTFMDELKSVLNKDE